MTVVPDTIRTTSSSLQMTQQWWASSAKMTTQPTEKGYIYSSTGVTSIIVNSTSTKPKKCLWTLGRNTCHTPHSASMAVLWRRAYKGWWRQQRKSTDQPNHPFKTCTRPAASREPPISRPYPLSMQTVHLPTIWQALPQHAVQDYHTKQNAILILCVITCTNCMVWLTIKFTLTLINYVFMYAATIAKMYIFIFF